MEVPSDGAPWRATRSTSLASVGRILAPKITRCVPRGHSQARRRSRADDPPWQVFVSSLPLSSAYEPIRQDHGGEKADRAASRSLDSPYVARSARLLYAAPPVRTPRSIVLAVIVFASCAAIGCAPRIGDGCQNSTNCSINGDRLCDTSQPGGACIVLDCQADRCPDDAVCVRFNPVPARRQIVGCMRRCSSDADCRSAEGYACVGTEDLAAMTVPLEAEVIDQDPPGAASRFCIALE